MTIESMIFAGADVSSGRKPVTLVTLDSALNVIAREKWSLEEFAACLKDYENLMLVVNSVSPERSVEVRKILGHAGFKQAARQGPLQWSETDAQQCFLALCEHELLSRRTLEGRIQRALILYEEGLRIPDPMDFFEEITRHKLMQGILPQENIYSIRELDALVSAYAAWMLTNEPRQTYLSANRLKLLKTSAEQTS